MEQPASTSLSMVFNDGLCTLDHLCGSCESFLNNSLIVLPPAPSWIARRSLIQRLLAVEQHPSIQVLYESAEAGCHFCTIVWYLLLGKKEPDIFREKWRQLAEPVVLSVIVKKHAGWWHKGLDPKLKHDDFYVAVKCGSLRRQLKANWNSDDVIHDRYHSAALCRTISSTHHMRLARDWLKTCTDTHTRCRKPDASLAPSRLVFIGNDSTETIVQIHQTHTLDPQTKYCTLSHCWGSATDVTSLTTTNQVEFQQNVAVSALPKTFQDAIYVTRMLGIAYLWIDSLCILQDSKEDWLTESAKMGDIYENCTLNIGALSSPNAHAGLFSARNPLRLLECSIAAAGVPGYKTATFGTSANNDLWYIYPRVSDLSTRAWILQEKILSPRRLYFSYDEIYWECKFGQACERDTVIKPRYSWTYNMWGETYWLEKLEEYKLPYLQYPKLESMSNPPTQEDLEKYHKEWMKVVTEYSATKLTASSDKLIAMSGLANRFRAQSGFSYAAGLWQESFLYDLCWQVEPGVEGTRPYEYRAPTWSWASVDGAVEDVDLTKGFTFLSELRSLSIKTHPSDKTGTGQVTKFAFAHLFGKLKQISPPRPKERVTDSEDLRLRQTYARPDLGWTLLDKQGRGIGFLHADTEPLSTLRALLAPDTPLFLLPTATVDKNELDGKKRVQFNKIIGLVLAFFVAAENRDIYNRVGFFHTSDGSNSLGFFDDVEPTTVFIV